MHLFPESLKSIIILMTITSAKLVMDMKLKKPIKTV